MSLLRYKYGKLGKLESLCIVFFNLMDSTSVKKDLEQSRRVNLAVVHNQLATGICSLYGGQVVKSIGDFIMATFNNPLEGMLAALDLIEKIHKDKLPFRAKSAFSHGIVTRIDQNDTDYIGNTVDRCFRLIDHALPGQILTDETTMEMIKPFLKDFNEMVSRFLGVKNLSGVGKVPVYEVALEKPGFAEKDMASPEVRADNSLQPEESAAAALEEPSELGLPTLAVPVPLQVPVLDRPLEGILEQCTPTVSELEVISLGYRNLCHVLEKAYDLNIRQVNLSGTFSRGTMIRPIQPIDVIAVMSPPPGQEKNVPETLEKFRNFFTRKSPGTEVTLSRGRIELVMNGVEFAIIPVLVTAEDGKVQLFITSSEGNFWVSRNPALPDQWMKKAIAKSGPTFLPFLRLVKAWQRTNCSYIKNFHLELLTELIASNVKLDLSFESVYLWFKHAYSLMTQNKKPFLAEPGMADVFVDDYIYSNALTFGRFGRVLTESYNLARQGITYHRAGEGKAAMAHWKTLFGTYMNDE